MRSRERRTTRTLIAALAGLSLVAAACGSDAADPVPDDETAPTTEMDMNDEVHTDPDMDMDDDEAAASDGTAVTDEAVTDETTEEEGATAEEAIPERIVSLSPTHTETLFAIGAGDQVVAVDQFSYFPEEATELPSELSGFEPNIEAIAAYEPDLVVLSGEGAVEQLEALGIATFVGETAESFDDAYTQIEQLGAVTGHVGDAAELVSSMQTRIDEIVAQVLDEGTGLTYFHEVSTSLYTSTSDTFIGQQYELLGLENIVGSSDENGGIQFPQLNAEVIIEASPDLIFLADTSFESQTSETVAARPGWDAIAAVQNGNVIEMDDDISSRWGPRIVDYMEAIQAAVAQVAVPAES